MKAPTRKQLQQVYDLAVDASFCSDYYEHDEEGSSLGRRQDILAALNAVRVHLKLRGRVEK